MSVLSRVMEESPARGTDRMVLTVLAYRADVAGLCFPSNKWTAKRAGISAAAAGRTIRELERAGEIVRFARAREDGGQSSNLILLARYADRAALDDHIAQGGQCAALIREYLTENPTICPPRLDASPPPSGVTPPPVRDDAPPPSGVTGHDSILDPIGTSEKDKSMGAPTDDAPPAADPTPPESLVAAGSANPNGTASQAEPNGTGKPKSRKSSAPPAPLGPGSLVYRDVIHLTPNHAQREILDAAHAAHGEAAMRAVMVAWMAHGYSPKNVAGMVDAINAGGLRANGHSGAGSRANGKPLSAMVLEI